LARVHVVVRSALAQAVRWGWVWDNPAERAHRITVTTRELHPPTPTELNTLLAHVADRDPMLHVLLVLAATTGARRAQLLALRWDNVHHDTMRISFCAGWVEGPNGPVLAATKTKRSHSVDLDAESDWVSRVLVGLVSHAAVG
jgi:integrase